jgi:hypothetical protein
MSSSLMNKSPEINTALILLYILSIKSIKLRSKSQHHKSSLTDKSTFLNYSFIQINFIHFLLFNWSNLRSLQWSNFAILSGNDLRRIVLIFRNFFEWFIYKQNAQTIEASIPKFLLHFTGKHRSSWAHDAYFQFLLTSVYLSPLPNDWSPFK